MARFPTRYTAAQFDKWRRIGNESPFYRLLDMAIVSAGDGEGAVRLTMRPELLQPAHNVHGGALASLIDSAIACSLMPSLGAELEITTIEMKVNFLSAMRGDVVAHGRAIHIGRTFAVGDATVVHVDPAHGEEPIAIGTATFAVRPWKRMESLGSD